MGNSNLSRKIISGGCSYLFTCLLVLLVVPCLVQAQSSDRNGQPYFSISTQIVSPDAMDVTSAVGFLPANLIATPGVSLDSELGWGVTGALGWLYDSNWHFEVELANKAFDTGTLFIPANPARTTGEWNVPTFFLNGGYDFRGESFITPYAELGVGVGLMELTFNTINGAPIRLNEQFAVSPAFQAKMGVNLEVADNMDIIIGYRFTTLITPDFDAVAFDRMDIHNFEMGLKFYIEDMIYD